MEARFDQSPHIQILNKSVNKLEFRLENVTRHFANAIRRVMIAEIPTMAIDKVEFFKNNTSLPEEYLAHRLGLIPFVSEDECFFNYFESCSCSTGGCPKCRVLYRLDVRNDTEGFIEVTSDDLELVDPRLYDDNSEASYRIHSNIHPAKLPAFENGEPEPILITKLSPGQELQLVCSIIKGIGRTHSKWSPVCVSAYHQIAEIKFNEDFFNEVDAHDTGATTGKRYSAIEKKEIIAQSCPCQVFRKNLVEDQIYIQNIDACTFCNQCIREAEILNLKDYIVINSKRGIFIFNVETIGMLPPERVVVRAFEILKDKLNRFKENVIKCNN